MLIGSLWPQIKFIKFIKFIEFAASTRGTWGTLGTLQRETKGRVYRSSKPLLAFSFRAASFRLAGSKSPKSPESPKSRALLPRYISGAVLPKDTNLAKEAAHYKANEAVEEALTSK